MSPQPIVNWQSARAGHDAMDCTNCYGLAWSCLRLKVAHRPWWHAIASAFFCPLARASSCNTDDEHMFNGNTEISSGNHNAKDPTLIAGPITSWFCFRPRQSQATAAAAIVHTGQPGDSVGLLTMLDDCLVKNVTQRKRVLAMAQHSSFVKEVAGELRAFGYVRS